MGGVFIRKIYFIVGIVLVSCLTLFFLVNDSNDLDAANYQHSFSVTVASFDSEDVSVTVEYKEKKVTESLQLVNQGGYYLGVLDYKITNTTRATISDSFSVEVSKTNCSKEKVTINGGKVSSNKFSGTAFIWYNNFEKVNDTSLTSDSFQISIENKIATITGTGNNFAISGGIISIGSDDFIIEEIKVSNTNVKNFACSNMKIGSMLDNNDQIEFCSLWSVFLGESETEILNSCPNLKEIDLRNWTFDSKLKDGSFKNTSGNNLSKLKITTDRMVVTSSNTITAQDIEIHYLGTSTKDYPLPLDYFGVNGTTSNKIDVVIENSISSSQVSESSYRSNPESTGDPIHDVQIKFTSNQNNAKKEYNLKNAFVFTYPGVEVDCTNAILTLEVSCFINVKLIGDMEIKGFNNKDTTPFFRQNNNAGVEACCHMIFDNGSIKGESNLKGITPANGFSVTFQEGYVYSGDLWFSMGEGTLGSFTLVFSKNYAAQSEGVAIESYKSGAGKLVLDSTTKAIINGSNYKVDSIRNEAFKGCSEITSFSVSGMEMTYGSGIFKNCMNLNSFEDSGLTQVPSGMFEGCTKLNSVTVGSLTSVEGGAFANTAIESIDLSNVTSFGTAGQSHFENCISLKSVGNISTTSIPASMFSGCSNLDLGDITISNLGSNSFKDVKSIKSITINSSATISAGSLTSSTSIDTVVLKGNIQFPTGYLINARILKIDCDGDITIPNSLFNKSGNLLTTIIVGSGNLTIGTSAFSECSNLSSVSDWTKVVSVGGSAFSGCSSLTGTIDLSNCSLIGNNAFSSCSGIQAVMFNDSIDDLTIGQEAFSGCSKLSTISHTGKIITIGQKAFYGTDVSGEVDFTSVSTIMQDVIDTSKVTKIKLSPGCNIDYLTVSPEVIEVNGSGIARIITTDLSLYMFPIDADSTQFILMGMKYASDSELELVIPSDVVKIRPNAFENQILLRSVTFPQDSILSSIGEYAFHGCSRLQSVIFSDESSFPSTITKVENGVFYECTSLRLIQLSENVLSIGQQSFQNCTSLLSIEMGGVSQIDVNAFKESGLITIDLSKVSSISRSAFQDCKYLENISFTSDSDKTISIGEKTFMGCSSLIAANLERVIFTNDSSYSLSGTGLEDVSLTATIVPQGTFSDCHNLVKVVFTSSVTLGNDVFRNCENLTYVSMKSEGSVIGRYSFAECQGLKSIGVDLEPNFLDLTGLGVDIKGVTAIGEGAFDNCFAIESVKLSKSLAEVHCTAFRDCFLVESFEIVDGNSTLSLSDDAVCIISGGQVKVVAPATKELKISSEMNSFAGVSTSADNAISVLSYLQSFDIQDGSIFNVLNGSAGILVNGKKVVAVAPNCSETGSLEIDLSNDVDTIGAFALSNVKVSRLIINNASIFETNALSGAVSLDYINVKSDSAITIEKDFLGDIPGTLESISLYSAGDVVIKSQLPFRITELKSAGRVSLNYGALSTDKIEKIYLSGNGVTWTGTLASNDTRLSQLTLVSKSVVNGTLMNNSGQPELRIIVPAGSSLGSLSYGNVYVSSEMLDQGKWNGITPTGLIKYDDNHGILYNVSEGLYYGSDLNISAISRDTSNVISIVTDNGHAVYDIQVINLSNNSIVELDSSGRYVLAGDADIFITSAADSGQRFVVTFISGDDRYDLRVESGHTILNDQFPNVTKPGYELSGWYYGTQDDSKKYSSDRVVSDVKLYAKWISLGDYLDLDVAGGKFISANTIYNSGMYGGGPLSLTFVPAPGFTLTDFKSEGQITYVKDLESSTLTISSVTGYAKITPLVTYVSQSSDLMSVVDLETPTTKDDLALAWAWSGGNVLQQGMVWSGMPSTPLIVDNHVFVHVDNRIVCLDSDTGKELFSTDQSKDTKQFYYHITYADGYVLDYPSGKVFSAEDLSFVCYLPVGMNYSVSYGGYLYGISESGVLYKMSVSELDSDKRMKNLMGESDRTYSPIMNMYGITSSPVVRDGFMYYVSVDSPLIDLNIVSLTNGESQIIPLRGITNYYLDDGWLTQYNGYLYLTAYTEGLFGTKATESTPRLLYFKMDGLQTTLVDTIELDRDYKSITSAFVIQNGRGYVNVCDGTKTGKLCVFDIDQNGNPTFVESIPSVSSHGSLVVSTNYYSEVDGVGNGSVYIYLLNYSTRQYISIFEDVCMNGEWSMVSKAYKIGVMSGYNSQAVRVGLNGQLIYYNDSGSILCYKAVTKNSFSFFVDSGNDAVWYESYGKDWTSALKSALDKAGIPYEVGSNSIISIDGVSGNSAGSGWIVYSGDDWNQVQTIGRNVNSSDHEFLVYFYESVTSEKDTKKNWVYLDNDEVVRAYSLSDGISKVVVGRQLTVLDLSVAGTTVSGNSVSTTINISNGAIPTIPSMDIYVKFSNEFVKLECPVILDEGTASVKIRVGGNAVPDQLLISLKNQEGGQVIQRVIELSQSNP